MDLDQHSSQDLDSESEIEFDIEGERATETSGYNDCLDSPDVEVSGWESGPGRASRRALDDMSDTSYEKLEKARSLVQSQEALVRQLSFLRSGLETMQRDLDLIRVQFQGRFQVKRVLQRTLEGDDHSSHNPLDGISRLSGHRQDSLSPDVSTSSFRSSTPRPASPLAGILGSHLDDTDSWATSQSHSQARGGLGRRRLSNSLSDLSSITRDSSYVRPYTPASTYSQGRSQTLISSRSKPYSPLSVSSMNIAASHNLTGHVKPYTPLSVSSTFSRPVIKQSLHTPRLKKYSRALNAFK